MTGEKLEEENSIDIPDHWLSKLFFEYEQNPNKKEPLVYSHSSTESLVNDHFPM